MSTKKYVKNHNYEKGKNNCVLNNHMLQFFTDSLVDNKEWGRNMISIKELPQRCGVSVATVSKALNDKSDIGEETKKRIRELADEMGYFPNASARTLRSKRSHCIGVLFGENGGTALTDEFFPKVLNAFKIAVEKRGYEIIFINKEVGGHTLSYLEHCRYRGVDGVVLAYTYYRDPEVIELIKSELPVVTVDRIFEEKTSVCFDYKKGMRDLVTYIYEKGHRKIAYIHGENSQITAKRVDSFYETMQSLGLSVPDTYMKEGRYLDFRKTRQLTQELLDLPDPPTCIIYPNDFSALGGIGAIHDRKLTIPEDISIAGYDGIPLAKAMSPELTTLEQDSEKMGEAIAERITALIENPGKEPIKRIMISGKVSCGNSVKNRN